MKEIKDWLENVKYELDTLWRTVKKLIKWIPIIIRDKDYDFKYFYDIMICKLETYSSYLEEKDRFESTPYKVSRMKTCIKLLERARDNFYNEESMKLISHVVKFPPVEGKPDLHYVDIKFEGDPSSYLNRHPLVCKKLMSNPLIKEDEITLAMRVGSYNHKRCKSLIFKILDRDIETWWD